MNIAGQVKEIVIGVLREKKAEGMRFAVVLDEWTSVGNCKYMNVVIFWGRGQFFNLGLVRITKGDADTLLKVLTGLLLKYEIMLDEDVTTDGAAVIIKFGKLFKPIHQLCYAYAIH